MDNTREITLEMEAALIGAALSAPGDVLPALASTLRRDYFLSPQHAAFFGAMLERYGKGLPTDPKALAAHFHCDWNAPLPGADLTVGQYVAGMLANAAPAMQIRAYADEVRNAWALRSLSAASEAAQANGMAGDRLAGFFAAADDVRTSLADIAGTREAAGDSARALMAKVNDRLQGKAAPVGATTGWRRVDDLLGGYIPGQLVVVAGRPGMGKTTVATSSAWQCASAGNGVAFFSLEMGQDDMASRLLADIAYRDAAPIHHSRIKAAFLNDAEFSRLIDAQAKLDALPLDIDYAGRLSVPEIGARIGAAKKRLSRRGIPLRVAFVDYLKQVAASDRYRGNRVQEVGEITAGLREVAKREGVCIVLMCQLNRGSEAQEDKRPELQHLRDSGDIEADADAVLFAYRPTYYLKKRADAGDVAALAELERHKHTLELIAAKNRNGPTTTATLFVDIAASAVREGLH